MTLFESGIGLVWLLILVLGLGTFGLRLSFIHLQDWIDGLPPQLENALMFIPPAILAALILPDVVVLGGSLIGTIINAKVIAAVLALVVAWRTGSMMATIGVGMAALWTSQYFIG